MLQLPLKHVLWFGFGICKQKVFFLLHIDIGKYDCRFLKELEDQADFFCNTVWSPFHRESSEEDRWSCCFCTTGTEMLIFKAITLQILS